MSSPNANNDFEQLDDPFASSGVGMDSTDMNEGGFGDPGLGDGGLSEGSQFGDAESMGSGSMVENLPAVGRENAVKEEVRYKKPRVDLFLVMLFLSWSALITVIVLLWFECHPSEYGEVPYQESSRPVVTSAS